MTINFQVNAIPQEQFDSLKTLSNDQLNQYNAKWIMADSTPGFPCRVSLQDAEVGEKILALPFMHLDVASPYQASGPIFVRQNARTAQLDVNEIPLFLRHRLLSVRAYNADHFMLDAEVVAGVELAETIERYFQNSAIDYLHIHNASPGCFMCAVERVNPLSLN